MSNLATHDTDDGGRHVSTEDLAAFLDGRLEPDARTVAITHFSECARCRTELTTIRAMGPLRPMRRFFRLTTVYTATAAVLAAIAAIPLWRSASAPVSTTRAADAAVSEDRAAIEIVRPNADASVPRAGEALVWRAVGSDATYRLVIQDSSGGVLWSVPTSDTTATPPAGLTLHSGETYYWTVDARLADGRSATSGLHRFFVR